MNTKEIDYIIVGQGLAGTMMAHFLLQKGAKIQVIDKSKSNSSSKVAAGLINPITGKRLVKSWEIEKLIPFAKKTYRDLEKLLDVRLWYPKKILRVLKNAGDENTWLARTAQETYQPYMAECGSYGSYLQAIPQFFGIGTISGAAQVDLPCLLSSFRQYLQNQDLLLDATFQHEAIECLANKNRIKYHNIEAKKIIFCEGADAIKNPYFNHLPFQISKGEILLVDFPENKFEEILKLGPTALIPLPKGYWLGATNSWDFKDDVPSKEQKEALHKKLNGMVAVCSVVKDHQAAIRPTVKDRRPFLGLHPDIRQLAVVNGLGTKGTSLAPFFSQKMVEFLLDSSPLPKEVNIERFL